MAPLKVGLVGCGRLAERGWIPALKLAAAAGVAEMVALAEPDRYAPPERTADPALKTSGAEAPADTPATSAGKSADEPPEQPGNDRALPEVVLAEDSQKATRRAIRRRPGGIQPTLVAEYDSHRI